MMDLGLGGPVDVGVQEGANHSGSCNDGVFGCSRCWNNANGGQGTLDKCEWCKKEAFTKTLHDPEDRCAMRSAVPAGRKSGAGGAEYEEEMNREHGGRNW